MQHLRFSSSKADGDIWMREAQKGNVQHYWENVLLYVDNALCVSERGEDVLRNELGKYFYIKQKPIAPPDMYLGNKVREVTLANDFDTWSLSSSQYVKEPVRYVEN